MRTMKSSCLTAVVMALCATVATPAVAGQAKPNPGAGARKAPAVALTPVAVDTDLACSVSIDGENHGDLPANGSIIYELPPGEHVLRAVSKEDASITWRQIVDVAGQRKAVLIELLPLLERKRAAAAERIKADEQMRSEADRKAADAERIQAEQARLAEQTRREKAADDQRAAEALRVRLAAERVETEKATALDAAGARATDGKRFSTALLLNGWKEAVPFKVSAAAEGTHPALIVSGPDARATLALMERAGKPAFRFEVLHSHGKDNAGSLYVTKTTIAYVPIQPQFKEDAFDIARTGVEKLKVDGDEPRIEFSGTGRDQRFTFVAQEGAAAQKGERSFANFGGLTARKSSKADTAAAAGIAMREWFKTVMLDFDAAQKSFERQTADVTLLKR